MAKELWREDARTVVKALQNRDVTPSELVDVAADRIEATDGPINAMVTLCLERAKEHGQRILDGEAPAGLLHGLPIGIKDMSAVAGVRTTKGSAIYKDNIPEYADAEVEALEDNGGVVIGKTNTPEFAAGANTFNELFGTTATPFDNRKTSGGSSGGAAAALAAGQVWLATGTDHGGSLRIPAAFCGVVGFRPSAGTIPFWPRGMLYETHSQPGPMARNIGDTGLMLDAMSRYDGRDPLTVNASGDSYRAAAEAPKVPARIAYSPNLGGAAPVEAEVAEVCGKAMQTLAKLGTDISDECPDFSDASQCFQIRRAYIMAVNHGNHYNNFKDQLKPDLIWNIEKGLNLTVEELIWAEHARTKLFGEFATFFGNHDLFITPTVMVEPFDKTIEYIDTVGDVTFDNYVDWLFHTYAITLINCPAVSIPCGLTTSGLPVGLQVVAPHHQEADLLSYAAAIEDALGYKDLTPIDPVVRD